MIKVYQTMKQDLKDLEVNDQLFTSDDINNKIIKTKGWNK